VILDYIEANKQVYGVAPICRVLTEHGCPIAPSTYYEPVAGHRRSGRSKTTDCPSRSAESTPRITRFTAHARCGYSCDATTSMWLGARLNG
jgi:hypothetical protein